MPFPRWLAGMRITADRLDDRNIMVVDQGEDQTVTSSTTVVDTNLIIPGEVGATYWYHAMLSYSADTAEDMHFDWDGPSGFNVRRFTWSLWAGASGLDGDNGVIMRTPATATDIAAGGTGAGNFNHASDTGIITIGGTAGNVVVRFAQNTSGAVGTIFRGQSRLIYARVG